MILKTLAVNLSWIIFFLLVTINVQARNEYLNDSTNSCERGSWETYTELRQHEYKSGTSNEYQDQTLGFRFRMPLGTICDDEFIAAQQKTNKIKTQLELIRMCGKVPRINPPPPAFAELINDCLQLGVMKVDEFETFDKSISYWDVLKTEWLKENPGVTVFGVIK